MSVNSFTATSLFLLVGAVTALPVWGEGSQLSMNGAIVATACDIDTTSRDQTVDMGTLPFDRIINDSQALSRPFSIRLVNCTLKHSNNNILGKQHFRVTFDGRNEDGRFGVEGQARGVALVLNDALGNEAVPGKALPPQTPVLQGKEMLLHYTARMVANNQPLQTGTYSAQVRYQLEYH
ncbi:MULTISPECIES: fimbrial protein [Serratia]|uniref:fimbrial protein n=1 Tax=Serratia TaxID=613 RepID=UPI0003AC955A|nr:MULTISPECIES: fimbrial protein [Serratia]ERK09857.1 MrfB [Serratia fonticola AU-AP2C]ERK12709.1 MrfB [Serratia fonticola AU-P3(3)]ATM76885.1 type 1 fimbrial protein [Serratia fonticola]MBP0997703.1 type 1 fimbrial protein [Serratia fonticola]MBP1001791.1 type 1 fimbrial protein [Serratia fonticola]